MQFKTLSLSALAAVAAAQTSTTSSASAANSASMSAAPQSSLNQASVLAILATAVPTSLAQLYLTNSASAYSVIESEFSAGSTPGWFQSLPTPVQTYLIGGAGSNITSPTGVPANGTAHNGTTVIGGTTRTKNGHTTVVGGSTSANGGMQTTMSATQGSSGSSSSSSGGAAIPTAMYGGALAGAVGIVGLLAL